MPIGTISMRSRALERDLTYTVLLPDPQEAGPGPYPVLLQFHGYYDNHSAWLVKSRIWGHTEHYPLIVVMPDGQNGWYANLARPNLFEDALVQDVWEHVNATYAMRPGRWAIGGLSMGGFGALRLGLKYPDKFCSIYAHSSAIPRGKDNWLLQNPDFSEALLKRLKKDLDCFHWAEKLDRTLLPRLTFDCGTEDFLLAHNRRFHKFLNKIEFPHTYLEFPGGHTWEYWDLHIQEAITQHAEILGIELFTPPPPGKDAEE